MIPRSHALVPQLPEQEAAAKAIIYVEEKRAKDPTWKCYSSPYAQAFLRFLCGKGKISGKSLNQIRDIIWDKEDKIPLSSYERALDDFISSRGRYCPTPLPSDLARYVFPENLFRRSDRQEKRRTREFHQYSRREQRKRQERENKYACLVGQAEIDLAFQTPESLRAWYLRWSQSDIKQYDLERMLWTWLERCPSLSHLERWQYSDCPVWVLESDIRDAAASLTTEQKALERWLVPNKLTVSVRSQI
ncbi:hypothetical protein YL93_20695 [Salmonella enterica subsp. enterica serovar Montevideo]|nr:hypothetical protein [Salmonella enterica subsp. enterica serovar Montevideo]